MSIKLDLVICTYNNAALLDRTLTAISKQQVLLQVEWKVLVVNNNCTDETPAVVDRHIRSGKIPHLITVSELRQGLTYARLCGIKNTTADWIAFVDDDCLLREDWIEQAVKFAGANPNCGAFGGKVILDWETPPPAYVLNYGYSFASQDYGMVPKQMSCLVGAGLVVRRSALSASGWIDKQFMTDRVGKKLISGGDVEIALRIRSAGYELWYRPECQLMHVIPERRTSNKYLININYGLGTCQQYADGMLWSGSYLAWLLASVICALQASVDVLTQSVKAAIGRRSAAEAAINVGFVSGRWAGIGRMIRMNAEERRALLGCAKVMC